MARYGYVRISSKDQNPDRQVDALVKYGLDMKCIFIDRISGKDFVRPEYKNLINTLECGDLVIIKSIDRLGRNYSEILNQWQIITKEKKADIEVIDMPLLNTRTVQNGLTGKFISDLVLQILAYVAETERTFIKKRQREGIASAKMRGVKFGRKKIMPTDEFEMAYELWSMGKVTSREAAKKCGMSHTTFYRRCKERQTE